MKIQDVDLLSIYHRFSVFDN